MKIELKQFTVKDVFEGYVNKEDEGEFALGGKLTIRPSYQREFVYDSKQEKAVMETVLNNFPLNSMYWILKEDGNYEVLDGQQRILSIMHYLNHNYTIKTASGDCYWDSLPDDQLEIIKNYPLQVYVCSEGTASEKLAWFKTINIAGEKLTDQELRNASFVGLPLSS